MLRCRAGSLKVLLQRAQSVAMWMIESACYIDLDDQAWSCLLVYEKTQPWRTAPANGAPAAAKGAAAAAAAGTGALARRRGEGMGEGSAAQVAHAKYRLVGFATVYRRAVGADATMEELREVTPRAEQVWENRYDKDGYLERKGGMAV